MWWLLVARAYFHREVQVPWGGVHELRPSISLFYLTEDRTGRLMHGLAKQHTVLREFIPLWSQNGSFETLQSCQCSNQSLFWSPCTYGHESLVMTESVPSQVKVAEVGFLRTVHGVTLRDKVHSCEIRKVLNIETLLRIERFESRSMVRARDRNTPKRWAR